MHLPCNSPWGNTKRRWRLFALTLTEDTQVSLLSSTFPEVPMWLGQLSTHFNNELLSSKVAGSPRLGLLSSWFWRNWAETQPPGSRAILMPPCQVSSGCQRSCKSLSIMGLPNAVGQQNPPNHAWYQPRTPRAHYQEAWTALEVSLSPPPSCCH